MSGLPVSIIITTYNEEHNITACLQSLNGFDDIIIVDSNSTDKTQSIARHYGTRVIPFDWNGQYPKKRQWILDHVESKYNYIFWLDADERLTPDFITALSNIKFLAAGYFVSSSYIWNNRVLKYGLKNKKLALMHRNQFTFPVIDDLDIDGMGEIEGHYQPVLKASHKNEIIGAIKTPYLHDAYQDELAWHKRHENYAMWEAEMLARDAYPREINYFRRTIKSIFKTLPRRDWAAFIHSYILKLGFLDGCNGYQFAQSRAQYYRMVQKAQMRLARQ